MHNASVADVAFVYIEASILIHCVLVCISVYFVTVIVAFYLIWYGRICVTQKRYGLEAIYNLGTGVSERYELKEISIYWKWYKDLRHRFFFSVQQDDNWRYYQTMVNGLPIGRSYQKGSNPLRIDLQTDNHVCKRRLVRVYSDGFFFSK